jgi:hypothetical protein
MAKHTFTAAGQASPEFQVRSDLESKSGSRFKIIYPALGTTNALQVEQKCSDGEWWSVYGITAGLSIVIDTPAGGLFRIKCSTYGGAPFSIIYQE